jgi:hypothetical protein
MGRDARKELKVFCDNMEFFSKELSGSGIFFEIFFH